MKAPPSSQKKIRPSAEPTMANALQSAILSRQLLPVRRSSRKKLPDKPGMSRVPVREALRRLEAEGWVSFDRGRGLVVHVATIEDVYETYVIRIALEGLAASVGTKQTDEEVIVLARSISKKMRRAEIIEKWLGLNGKFHFAIYGQSRMKCLLEVIKQYTLVTSR